LTELFNRHTIDFSTAKPSCFDDITLRVADLAVASRAFRAALDQLEIERDLSKN
jgi:hypothetical protein